MAEQRSAEWHAQRAGKITGSRFADAIAFTKDGKKPLAARTTLMRTLAFERLSLTPQHQVTGKALAWGTDIEGFGKEAYELESGNIILPAEFITHPMFPFIGASPDGFVGKDGLVELKSPMDESVHVGTWLDGMPEDHVAQVQGQLWVTGRQWLDFVSYDPRQAERFRLYVERVNRDESYIAKLSVGLLQFEAELQELIKSLERRAVALQRAA